MQCCEFDHIRETMYMRSSDSVLFVPLRFPQSTPSTKHRRYQHAIYLVLHGKHGKTQLPSNDCNRG